jgi:hypothetical protein
LANKAALRGGFFMLADSCRNPASEFRGRKRGEGKTIVLMAHESRSLTSRPV